MDNDNILVTGIEMPSKGIKISYDDRSESKTLFAGEMARPEFYDAATQVGKEALLLPNFGALNEREIKESKELMHIYGLTVEKLTFSTVKDLGSVVTLRVYICLKDGMGTTIILEKVPYSPASERPFDKAIMKYEEEAKKYLKGERAQRSLFEKPEEETKQEAANE